ncbi:hypothetical protein BGW36DRAFT_429447 [Talaromyces proteolyticus]|uniref:Uncharacterized protein n=1 Tax=Talaromyces proteolyticus TaxID=1131652 RepID=A0AAD4KPX9_9EURO|nr:uncharacterized protein BGW36DRAFT_429447 [Talaromyces proteolyticus]KAH8695573.1 hypothetical protein BGW36DRAFT_429447 [Talaromyces proteolyticus]
MDLIQLDVTNDEQIAAVAKHVELKYGKLDVPINNAGILRVAPANSTDLPTRAARTMSY